MPKRISMKVKIDGLTSDDKWAFLQAYTELYDDGDVVGPCIESDSNNRSIPFNGHWNGPRWEPGRISPYCYYDCPGDDLLKPGRVRFVTIFCDLNTNDPNLEPDHWVYVCDVGLLWGFKHSSEINLPLLDPKLISQNELSSELSLWKKRYPDAIFSLH